MRLLGIDACRQGWLVAQAILKGPSVLEGLSLKVVLSLRDVLLTLSPPATVAIDIPVGLLDDPSPGGRPADRLARRLLGHPRASSVFSPPLRSALKARDYQEARRLSGGSLNRQAYNLLCRIREVDELIPFLRPGVFLYEVHPEVSFWAMALAPLGESKRCKGGRLRRRQILAATGIFPPRSLEAAPSGATVDDLLDAFAALWTAWRIARNRARCLPSRPLKDGCGQQMAIWF
ncbi:DUF429 domain-containing protein [Thermosulfuriphilus sp.]